MQGGGYGGDPFVDFSNKRSSTPWTPTEDRHQHDRRDVRISEIGGLGGYSLAVAVVILLIVLGVVVVGALI